MSGEASGLPMDASLPMTTIPNDQRNLTLMVQMAGRVLSISGMADTLPSRKTGWSGLMRSSILS